MASTDFSTPSRSTSVCTGRACCRRPAAVITAFLTCTSRPPGGIPAEGASPRCAVVPDGRAFAVVRLPAVGPRGRPRRGLRRPIRAATGVTPPRDRSRGSWRRASRARPDASSCPRGDLPVGVQGAGVGGQHLRPLQEAQAAFGHPARLQAPGQALLPRGTTAPSPSPVTLPVSLPRRRGPASGTPPSRRAPQGRLGPRGVRWASALGRRPWGGRPGGRRSGGPWRGAGCTRPGPGARGACAAEHSEAVVCVADLHHAVLRLDLHQGHVPGAVSINVLTPPELWTRCGRGPVDCCPRR